MNFVHLLKHSKVQEMVNYDKDVATSGSAEQVDTDQGCREIFIQAKPTNTGLVYVGTSATTAGSGGGAVLSARESLTFSVTNLNDVWVDVDVNGEGVTGIYWK